MTLKELQYVIGDFEVLGSKLPQIRTKHLIEDDIMWIFQEKINHNQRFNEFFHDRNGKLEKTISL